MDNFTNFNEFFAMIVLKSKERKRLVSLVDKLKGEIKTSIVFDFTNAMYIKRKESMVIYFQIIIQDKLKR